MADVILASGSPRRLALLRLVGLEPVVRPVDVDERPHPGEAAPEYVARLARDKAAAVAENGAVVLAADTTVVLDGEVLGKPRDAAHAADMLQRLQGRGHAVSTGVAVLAGGQLHELVVTTEVEMVALERRTIDWYVGTGEPLDKAGGYGIQGRAAAFVRRIDGSWTNVVGLPLAEACALLRKAGVALP